MYPILTQEKNLKKIKIHILGFSEIRNNLGTPRKAENNLLLQSSSKIIFQFTKKLAN